MTGNDSHDSDPPGGDPGGTRDDLDRLVERATAAIVSVARRAGGFATRLALATTLVCVAGFALGVAALEGGIETVWIVLAIVFGAIAIGSAVVARWRVGMVRRRAPELADDVRALLTGGPAAARSVIETFVVDDPPSGGPTTGSAELGAGSVVVFSRRLADVRDLTGNAAESTARLTAAVTAITSFPALVLVAVAISTVFAGLGAIFLLALALG